MNNSTYVCAMACLAIVAGITYGCTQSSRRYHDSMSDCISNGGSWVAMGWSNDASCIAPRGKMQ